MDDLDLECLSLRYGCSFDRAERVVAGVNRTYRLSSGAQHHYLRMYRPTGRSRAEIAFELRLLRQCRPTPGIDVARPIATSDGADLISLSFGSQPRYGCLFTALEGRPLTHASDDMKRFGSSIAKLHGALSGIVGSETRPLDPLTLCRRAIEALESIANTAPTRRAIEAWCGPAFGDATRYHLPSGNCHGDAWAGNAVVQGSDVGFLDFDDCGHGPYVIDLGTAAWHLIAQDGPAAEAHLAALISGYEEVRTLEEDERRRLFDFVKLAEVRSMLFLAAFNLLDEQQWQHTFARAQALFARERPF